MSRLLAIVLTISVGLTACSDPNHGAWKFKPGGIWLGLLTLAGLLLGALLMVGVGYQGTRALARRRMRKVWRRQKYSTYGKTS